MKYRVTDRCIGCGLCEGSCPEVFSMTADGTAIAIDTDVPEEAAAGAAEACSVCPAEAIEEVREYTA